MVGQSQQNKLDKGAYSGKFPVNLPVAHPFRKQQDNAAAEGEKGIGSRRIRDRFEKIGRQKDGGSDLMESTNKDGELQYPVRAITYSALSFFSLLLISLLDHRSPYPFYLETFFCCTIIARLPSL